MNARVNLTLPDGTPTKLVVVSAFVHENVVPAKQIAARFCGGYFNFRDFTEVDVPVLHIRNAEIRQGDRVSIAKVFALSHAAPNLSQELEPLDGPVSRDATDLGEACR